MKYYHSFTLVLVFLFSFSACKKDNDGDKTDTAKEELLFKGFELLDSSYTEFYKFAGLHNGNAAVALYETGKWILNKGTAEDVYIIDSTYLYIVMSSEIILNFNINYVGANGKSIYRGSPQGGNALMRLTGSEPCSNTIPNNNVLMWGAADNLDFDYSTIKGILNDSDVDFTPTELRISQCTPASLKTINQFGLVLFDTHGVPDATLTGSSINLDDITNAQEFKNAVVAAVGQENFELFLSGALRLSKGTSGALSPDIAGGAWWTQPANTVNNGKYYVWATAKFIQSLPLLTSTIVFNNSCYSGATILKSALTNVNGAPVIHAPTATVANAFLSRNPITYYGWKYDNGTAGAIDDRIAIDAEENFITRLADEKDSTGQAHFDMDGDYFSFIHPFDTEGKVLKLSRYNNESYCYPSSCGTDLTDPRDGKTYKTVCIGDQVWMAENLNYNSGTNWCYDNNSANCEQYGRLYDWQTAKVACPPGWHLPSEAEWLELSDTLGGESIAGGKMKALTSWNPPNTGATDSSNFSALASGIFSSDTSLLGFNYIGERANYWSSTPLAGAPNFAEIFTLSRSNGFLLSSGGDGTYGFSCRCVKD